MSERQRLYNGDMHLPIDKIRPEFDQALERNQRLVVTAETGAGKSTRVPVWLTEQTRDMVVVVEPRRVACHALADFLASERGEKAGQFFGSRVRFSDRSGPQTRVLFCTPGVALRMLGGDTRFGAIVVDEFHERSWQMDLVVAAAASLDTYRETPLILTSATIDAEQAADVLGAETLHATGRTFPVEISYDESAVEPTDDDIGPRAARSIAGALNTYEGDVLVFLPGMKEIRAVESSLGRRSEEILVVHGSQPPEAMRRVFSESDRRRIYLSTNVAETSITLPGVRVVIDSGLAKTRLHKAGRAALATVPISQASMDQRAGRAGRVAEGACIRLWSERYRPDAYQTPEIERTELDDLLLQAAEIGLEGEDFDSATWITAPPDFAVERARRNLEGLSALEDGALTERGIALAELPVSAEEASMLVGAPPEIDATLCDLVAILQSRGTFLRNLDSLPRGKQIGVKESRGKLLAGITDEVTMNLTLMRQGDARKHHLSDRRLREARSISQQLRNLINARGEGLDGLAEFILTRLPEAGFVLRPRAQKKGRTSRSQPWANGSIEVNVYPFEPLDRETDAANPTAGIILETEWLGSGTRIFGIGRMLLPTRGRTLAEAGLGESIVTQPQVSRSRRGNYRITATREVQLAGVTLEAGESDLVGKDLHRVVARFVFENRMFKGAAEPIRDALHAWELLADWREDQDLGGYEAPAAPEPRDPVEWLTKRLATLGVHSAADLSLLENDDLVADLDQETGIPSWVYAPLVEDFPRVWSYQGSNYTCSVNPAARKVTLEPDNKSARNRGEPPSSVVPRFRGFKVDFRQDSRRVRLR